MNKLKQRWGISSNFQLAMIIVVFAITGSTAAYLSKPILQWFGLNRETASPWLYYPLYILLIFPVYQVLLVAIGSLFGQRQFFWAFEKKLLRATGFGFLFGRKKNSRD